MKGQFKHGIGGLNYAKDQVNIYIYSPGRKEVVEVGRKPVGSNIIFSKDKSIEVVLESDGVIAPAALENGRVDGSFILPSFPVLKLGPSCPTRGIKAEESGNAIGPNDKMLSYHGEQRCEFQAAL
ncbi:hypothetical protein ACH5RR_029119 [Cinchona calisaya]|uniref:Uncharacterized protein n=1 Tax=Cinchona calisaya TaxID=153742 RepID=A0ABD2YW02_9GENT